MISSSHRSLVLWFSGLVLAGCASTGAEGRLAVQLGSPRPELESQLRHLDFCPSPGDVTGEEVYPRCARAGADWGEAWVAVSFDGERARLVRRWERFADPERAVERWNHLVGAWTAATAAGDVRQATEAKQAILAVRKLPSGTRSWTAFRIGEQTAVGVYLLSPTPPEDASILEEIITVPSVLGNPAAGP